MNSMTGYGRGSAQVDGTCVSVEISSVNHRQRDLRFHAPLEVAGLEVLLKPQLTVAIERGAVTVNLSYDLAPEVRASQFRFDEYTARQAVNALRRFAEEAGISTEIRAGDLVAVPGIITLQNQALPQDTLVAAAQQALQTALREFLAHRAQEGKVLQDDLQNRCAALAEIASEIEMRKDDAVNHYRNRLRERIAMLGLELDLGDERLLKEVAFAAQKADFTEELVRLKAHMKQFADYLAQDNAAVGRHLQFVGQEMHREINTLVAKTSETAIADLGIRFKAELDRVREQACNVE